jgi:uncharacterized membrane protein YkoI
MKYVKGFTLAAAVTGVALIGLSTNAFSQAVDDDTPIQGTIQVTEGADYQALVRITAEQARTAALAQAPGATVEESDLDEEDGYLVYEVEIQEGTEEIEVLVDAGSGAVLRTDREIDDDHDDDDDENDDDDSDDDDD